MSAISPVPLVSPKSHKKSKEKHKHKYKDKKRKEAPTEEDVGAKRPQKKSKSAKGKERAKQDSATEFVQMTSTLALSLPPYYTTSPLKGAISVLDGLVMKYIPSLGGVLLSHSNARFTQKTALVQPDSPFLKCNVMFDCIVWSPRIGMKLSGYHSISSPSHMSLLVHRTFNVSIPSSHIPQPSSTQPQRPQEEAFRFVFGASTTKSAQNRDQKDTPDANPSQDDIAEDEPPPEEHYEEERGQWISSLTNCPISGLDESKSVEFTVIGLTIANSMISLIGSLQPDPFSPRHSFSITELIQPIDSNQMDVDQEADDIEEVEKELSIHPGAEDMEDEIQEPVWTQDQEQATKLLAPATEEAAPMPMIEEKREKEKSPKKRKRKDKVKDKPEAGGQANGGGEERPKKKKKKKSESEPQPERQAVDGEQAKEVKKEKKKKKKKRVGDEVKPDEAT